MSIQSFRQENYYLSNMYQLPNPIPTPYGESAKTSEQLYLSSRFLSEAARRVILEAETGFSAKKISNEAVKGGIEIRQDWDRVKVDKMRDAVLVKFVANPELAAKLLATGEEELIEGNKRGDTFWGVAPPPPFGKGQNMLGKVLMETRDLLSEPDALATYDIDELVGRVFSTHD